MRPPITAHYEASHSDFAEWISHERRLAYYVVFSYSVLILVDVLYERFLIELSGRKPTVMKPETIRLLRRIMFLYFVPWLYFDVAGMLAMTDVYYLPLIPLSPTNNGFFTLLATALDSIIVGAVGLIGWTYVNRQWRRLRPKSP